MISNRMKQGVKKLPQHVANARPQFDQNEWQWINSQRPNTDRPNSPGLTKPTFNKQEWEYVNQLRNPKPVQHRPGLSIDRPQPRRQQQRAQQKQPIRWGDSAWSDMGSGYDYKRHTMQGWVNDPNSPTGWTYVDKFGRTVNARKPRRGERDRIIAKNTMLSVNPYFWSEGRRNPTQQAWSNAPWVQGFEAGEGGWVQTTDGGWFNPRGWLTWKPGDPIPARHTQSSGGGSASTGGDVYTQLLRAFGAL